MKHCSICGSPLPDNAKFCPSCGVSAASFNQPKKAPQRITQYDGVLHRCPNCGEVLPSFGIACPSCGTELRNLEPATSISELAHRIHILEMQRPPQRRKVLLSHLEGLSSTDEQIVSAIRSFPIPNTREDLIEFAVMASSNIDESAYINGSDNMRTPQIAISDAWMAKLEQVNEKAKLLFGKDASFAQIQDIYDRSHRKIKRAKNRLWRICAYVYGALAVLIVAILLVAFLLK